MWRSRGRPDPKAPGTPAEYTKQPGPESGRAGPAAVGDQASKPALRMSGCGRCRSGPEYRWRRGRRAHPAASRAQLRMEGCGGEWFGVPVPRLFLCVGALHPIRRQCTSSVRVHRHVTGAPPHIGCSAPTNKNKRGTGTPNHSPPHPSMRTWALLAAGWARRPRHHLHSGPLRHLLHPYMRRAGKDAERAGARRRREKRSARPGAGQGPASGPRPTGRRSSPTRPRTGWPRRRAGCPGPRPW